MDATHTLSPDSWFMQLSEHTIRSFAAALVLTGQMLPSGAVSAQDTPAPPSFISSADVPPVPPTAEAVKTPTAPMPEPEKPAEPKAPAAETETHKPGEATLQPTLAISPQSPPQAGPAPATNGVHVFGDWKMTIRPGIVPARLAPVPQGPCREGECPELPGPQNSVSVPVTVNVNNQTFPNPTLPYGQLWSVPSTYPTWQNAPTAAYLFQRPRPYWQLRGDFFHLRPFIPGLWY